MSKILWKAFEHSYSRKEGAHVILVGYKKKSHGIGKGLGTVVAAAPLYDLRDFNWDGSVSFLEKAYAGAVYDPYELNSLLMPAAETDFKVEAGNAVGDYMFGQKAKEGFLKQAFKATARAALTITVEKVLGPGIEKTLAVSALSRMGAAGEAAMFVIQASLETVIMESIARTHVR